MAEMNLGDNKEKDITTTNQDIEFSKKTDAPEQNIQANKTGFSAEEHKGLPLRKTCTSIKFILLVDSAASSRAISESKLAHISL